MATLVTDGEALGVFSDRLTHLANSVKRWNGWTPDDILSFKQISDELVIMKTRVANENLAYPRSLYDPLGDQP